MGHKENPVEKALVKAMQGAGADVTIHVRRGEGFDRRLTLAEAHCIAARCPI